MSNADRIAVLEAEVTDLRIEIDLLKAAVENAKYKTINVIGTPPTTTTTTISEL